jgi:hypothetical protein
VKSRGVGSRSVPSKIVKFCHPGFSCCVAFTWSPKTWGYARRRFAESRPVQGVVGIKVGTASALASNTATELRRSDSSMTRSSNGQVAVGIPTFVAIGQLGEARQQVHIADDWAMEACAVSS